MDVGQVGFHVDKNVRFSTVINDFFSFKTYFLVQVKQYVVNKKQNDIVNRLNRTKKDVSTEDFIVKIFELIYAMIEFTR